MWSKACKRSSLFAIECSKLWHEGDEALCGDGTDAWNGLQDICFCSQFARLNEVSDGGVDGGQLVVERFEDRSYDGISGFGTGGFLPIAPCGSVSDDIASCHDEGVQLDMFSIAWNPAFQAIVSFLPIARKGACIDGVGFGQRTKGSDKSFHLPRISPVHGPLSYDERIEQRTFIAAGCFANYKAVGIKTAGKASEAIGFVGKRYRGLIAAGIDDDLGFADITADIIYRVGHGTGSPLAFDCLRALFGSEKEAHSTHQALQECDRTTMMTAGESPIARRSIRPRTVSGGRQAQCVPTRNRKLIHHAHQTIASEATAAIQTVWEMGRALDCHASLAMTKWRLM